MPSYASEAIYFQNEGKENLDDCLKTSMAAIIRHGLNKLVIFTAKGEGLEAAIKLRSQTPALAEVKLVGVTFPQGKLFAEREGRQPPTRIEPDLLKMFSDEDVSLIKARLPFDPIWSNYPTNSTLAQEMSIIGTALNIFGGGASLCVQAVLMACDAGEIDWGEHVVVMSADTSLLVRAAPTDHFMTDLIVREFLCKPIFLNISRKEEIPVGADETVLEPVSGDIDLLAIPEEEGEM